MAPIVIEVAGQSSTSVPAERCTLSITVSHSSTDQTQVHEAVTSASNELSEYLSQACPKDASDTSAGVRPITKWNMSRLSTSSWERLFGSDPNSKIKERMYNMRTTFSITFSDFELLSKLCLDMSTNEYFAINSMSWHVTSEKRDSVQREVRQGAVRDAMSKAEDYASVFSTSGSNAKSLRLTPININDGSGSSTRATGWGAAAPAPGAVMRSAAFGASNTRDTPSLNFHPEDVTISSWVNCVFHFDPDRPTGQ